MDDAKKSFLFLFAKRNAKYGNRSVVKACMDAAKPQNLFGMKHIFILQAELLYGSIRPGLRKMYYRFFVRAK